MRNAVTVLQYVARLLVLSLVVLGVQFWMGRALALVPVHMAIGKTLIVLLWILAAVGLWAGVKPGFAIGAILYGILTLVFAVTMGKLLPGRAHEIIRVLHLLLGLGVLGLVEMLGARTKRRVAKRDTQ